MVQSRFEPSLDDSRSCTGPGQVSELNIAAKTRLGREVRRRRSPQKARGRGKPEMNSVSHHAHREKRRLQCAHEEVRKCRGGNSDTKRMFFSFSQGFSLNYRKSQGKFPWNPSASLEPVGASVWVLYRRGKSLPANLKSIPSSPILQRVTPVTLLLQKSPCLTTKSLVFLNAAFFLHYQPHRFLCRFDRKDLNFFSPSAKFPTLHLFWQKQTLGFPKVGK